MANEHIRDQIFDQQLSREEIETLLSPIRFADPHAAYRCLLRIAVEPPQRRILAGFLPQLLSILSTAAEPDRVLRNFELLASNAPDLTALLQHLDRNPRTAEILATLFAGSQFLTEILFHNPEYFERLTDPTRLSQVKTVEELTSEAETTIRESGDTSRQLGALRHFQRWQLLRIGACDLLDLYDMSTATMQLSALADSMVRACLTLASGQTGQPIGGFTVLAMGKLGGEELNYSSDIDLLFLSASDADTFRPLAQQLIDALTRVTPEGFLYRVDTRLRPWGEVGALVSSVDGHLAYLRQHARLWEKQALLKARVIAGDDELGSDFLRRIDPILFDMRHVDVRAEVHSMKQLTETHLRRQGRTWGEVKLGEGSIRDIEFVVQYLQLVYGGSQPELRSRTTLDALARLSVSGLLSAADYRVLADGYVLLRTIEHHLQMMHYRQTHTLPADPEALGQLARRLGFQGDGARDSFLARYQEHCAAIRASYLQHLGADAAAETRANLLPNLAPSYVQQHISRLDPSYARVFGADEIQQHSVLAAQLDSDHLVEVNAVPLDGGRWRVTIIAYDYPGELSLICGLLLAYGFNIDDGNAFTYQPEIAAEHESAGEAAQQKIVDVFMVDPVIGEVEAGVWAHYAVDLARLLQMTRAGQRHEARGELAQRVAVAVLERSSTPPVLYPVDIEIDNSASERFTLLTINAPDTVGFLYELTNALALSRIDIARVTVETAGHRVHDTLHVTDLAGNKIADEEKLRELRAAIVLIKHFTHLLPLSPNPEAALLHFHELIGQLFRQPGWPDELTALERPEVLAALARALGVSDFLWDDFLRMQYASLFPVVKDVTALAEARSREALHKEWAAIRAGLPRNEYALPQKSAWREALNAFKDREMFRVDMRHILGHTQDFGRFSEELTDLAEVIIEEALQLCLDEMAALYGLPLDEGGRPCPLAVFGLGKLGGRELGFASDIELMFIYAGSGATTGPRHLIAAEFYEKLVETFVDAIHARREGIFQIDLQLRPYGKAGSLAVSLDSFRRYFAPRGPAWDYERQALVKLRPVAGDPDLGQSILSLRDEFVYTGAPFNATAMRAMRERQIRHLVTGGTLNVKFSPGGLIDVEYLVQGLQVTYGHGDSGLRSTNTRQAMAALAVAGVLSQQDYERLSEAHLFLRLAINALRVVRGNAKDMTVPPDNGEEFAFLTRRMGYDGVAHLRADFLHYTATVQEITTRLLG